jgi:glycosyltransferase involved in cell wall biosynthesis
MRLDIVIATYRRPDLLTRTLESLLRAPAPDGLDWNAIVVDNNSRDNTRETVEALQPRFGGRLQYLLETKQGSSHARNAGILASRADIVATIDDDEEIGATWFTALYEAFADPTIDYIGGPYHPNWEVAPPDWVPLEGYAGVVGIVESSPVPVDYGNGFDGCLISGNSAFRRSLFDKLGLYDPALGRTATGLLSCEDHDLFLRLQSAGFHGRYIPDFGIHHWIPVQRMTAAYHREWVFGNAMSIVRLAPETGVVHLFGIPRYFFGDAVRRTLRWLRSGFDFRLGLLAHLAWIGIAGRLYGRTRMARS